MEKFHFYDVKEDYINYLKRFDNKVPDVKYLASNKFFCGIVLNINGFNYYAPVSSFNKQQKTNILIYDKTTAISSIRFCFMCPVPLSELTERNIKIDKDKTLLNKELNYCNSIREKIKEMADRVYKYGTNPKHYYFNSCCNFKILELKCKEYR